MDCSLLGSSVHEILQARILEWVAMPFSRGSSWPRDRTQISCIAGRFFTNWAMREAQTGVGCHALLQGIFPIQELNLGLLHCRRIVYHLSHEENPKILEWVVCPFSRRSSQPRNRTRVSCIAGGFFTSWTTREAHHCIDPLIIHWDLQSSIFSIWFLLHLLAEILE